MYASYLDLIAVKSASTASTPSDCAHEDLTSNDSSIWKCVLCGKEMERDAYIGDEFCNYGNKRKTEVYQITMRNGLSLAKDPGLRRDVTGKGLTDSVIQQANEIYQFVMKQSNGPRGVSRVSIVCGCVYYAMKGQALSSTSVNGKGISIPDVAAIFDLRADLAKRGVNYVRLNIPLNSLAPSVGVVTVIDTIDTVMTKFEATEALIQEVIEIYQQVKHKSLKINQSRPQSIAGGVIWYWLVKTGRNTMSRKAFASESKILASDNTIDRMFKEIKAVLEPVDMKK